MTSTSQKLLLLAVAFTLQAVSLSPYYSYGQLFTALKQASLGKNIPKRSLQPDSGWNLEGRPRLCVVFVSVTASKLRGERPRIRLLGADRLSARLDHLLWQRLRGSAAALRPLRPGTFRGARIRQPGAGHAA